LDLATAHAFFGKRSRQTAELISASVKHLCATWNEESESVDPEDRSHFAEYHEISSSTLTKTHNPRAVVYEQLHPAGSISRNLKRGAGGGQAENLVHSQVCVIVSNWHFVRDHKSDSRFVPCKPQDCTIALKLSSTEFRKKPWPRANPGLQRTTRVLATISTKTASACRTWCSYR